MLFKVKVYDDDNYVNLDRLSSQEKHSLELSLLEILKIGSTIEPINCPVHGMRLNWENGVLDLTVRPEPTCTPKSLEGYINFHSPASDNYAMEVRTMGA